MSLIGRLFFRLFVNLGLLLNKKHRVYFVIAMTRVAVIRQFDESF